MFRLLAAAPILSFATLFTLAFALAFAPAPAPAQEKWTPPPAIEIAGLIGNRLLGNWPLANRQMETALEFMHYDYRYWWGAGFHGSRHAAVMLPEMLTWLWAEQ